MGTPLKDAWGLTEPPSLSEASKSPQEAKLLGDFKTLVGQVNERLQTTKTLAEKARHMALVTRRDAQFAALQSVREEIDPADESKAKPRIERFLADLRALVADAGRAQQEAERAGNAWQSRSGAFDKGADQLDELDRWEDQACPELRKAREAVQVAVNERRLEEAVKLCDAHLSALKVAHDNYLKQRDAKAVFEPQFHALNGKLPKGSLPPEKMAPHVQKRIADTRQQIDSRVADKDYVQALTMLDGLSLDAGDPDVLAFEGKVLRADVDQLVLLLKQMAETKGIMATAEFCGRFRSASPLTLLRGSERPGLLQDVLKELDSANKRLDEDRKAFCEQFEKLGNDAAREVLANSRRTIETEMKRLGISAEKVQLETDDGTLTYTCQNAEEGRAARKAAGDLIGFARAVDDTGKASAQAFEQLGRAQRSDPFNLMNRPLVEAHEAKRKAWMEASEKFEQARRAAVASQPSIALFAEEPGIVAKLTGLSTMPDAAFANEVGRQSQERLDNITKVEAQIGGSFVVWNQSHLTRVTLDQMGANPFQRDAVQMAAQQKQRDAANEKLVFAALAVGLGLLAAIPTGGSSLLAGLTVAAGVAGAGLALYQVGAQVNEYTLATAANATDFDKAKAISDGDPNGYELALNCVMALGDVFAAAAAFKALNGLVKAVKAGDAAAALKLAQTAERVGIQGAARSKIVGEAVQGLSPSSIEALGKSMARGGGGGAELDHLRKAAMASGKADFGAQIEYAMELMKDLRGRIPDTARRMVDELRVFEATEQNLIAEFGAERGAKYLKQVQDGTFGGLYHNNAIFLASNQTREEFAGALIHECMHHIGDANPLRKNDFMSEAVAEFAERDFYNHIYDPAGGPLRGAAKTERIENFTKWTDEELLADIEKRYYAAHGDVKFKNFEKKNADDVIEELFDDIYRHYIASLPKP